MLIGVLSDTHVLDKSESERLFDKIKTAFQDVELIIHAGDVCTKYFINLLNKISPTEVVCGNSDDETIRNTYPPFKTITIEGVKIGISHESLSLSIIEQENLKIVINGHTHIPAISEDPGVLYLNPGSPTLPRAPPPRKMYQKQRMALSTVIILELTNEFSSAYIYSFK
jgi:putative phosphoesterase